jgi:iron complex transport system ATP-binding protein
VNKTNSHFIKSHLALETRRLTVGRDSALVLNDLSLKISQGSWCALVGPNGAGKSTLLQVLAGILPFQGEVQLFGQPLQQQTARSRARRIAWLDQSSVQSADDLTAYDVVMLGRIPHQAWLGGASVADHDAVERALTLTGAWAWRDRALGTLSGGEKQRVLLARLLAVEADIFLMDEPLANLDPPHQTDWLILVRELVAQGKTVVSVLHEVTLALYADELIIVAEGQVRYTGKRDDPALHRTIENVFEHRITIQPVGDRWVALPTVI